MKEIKKRIEKELHKDGTLTKDKEQIDRLVDNVCSAVCRHFHKARELDGQLGNVLTSRNKRDLTKLEKARAEVLNQILHAYNTMHETHGTLVELEQCVPGVSRSTCWPLIPAFVDRAQGSRNVTTVPAAWLRTGGKPVDGGLGLSPER